MSDDPTIGFLKADVARFCAGLDDLAPAIRLRLVVPNHHQRSRR